MNYNFILYLHLPLVNNSTTRRRTASTASGAQDGENYATPSGKKLDGTAAYISQPDLEPESRSFHDRRRMRIPGREGVATGSSSSDGGILIDPGARLYRTGSRDLCEY